MDDMFSTGVIKVEELYKLNLAPSRERMKKGPVVVVECVQEIPCDACVAACPVNAITKQEINLIPIVDFDKCKGCGSCLLACPGLAIFLVDLSSSDGKGRVTVPYELLPVPDKGDEVVLLDRLGAPIGKGNVVKIVKGKNYTYAVTLEVDEDKVMDVRAFKVI